MEKVKKMVTNIICIVIIIMCGGIIWIVGQIESRGRVSLPSWIHQWKTEPIVEEPVGQVRIQDEIVEGVHFGESGENYCLVYKLAESASLEYEWIDGEYMDTTFADTTFSAKYIVRYHQITYYSRELEMPYEERLKSFILYVTPTDGEEIQTKEIDMLKVFEKLRLPYLPFSTGEVVEREGKNYVELRVEPRMGNEGVKRVLFGLEEERVIEDKSMLFEHSVRGRYIREVSKYSLASIDIQTGSGRFSYSPVEDLLQSRLAKEYPEIRELVERIERNEGERILVGLYFKNVDDPDEIMRLFEKEGVDPFENTELREKASKDGKRHKINSFEDFLKWYDFSENQKEEVEMLLGESEE